MIILWLHNVCVSQCVYQNVYIKMILQYCDHIHIESQYADYTILHSKRLFIDVSIEQKKKYIERQKKN